MPRTVAALLVLPLAVDQATATAPGQIDPNGAFLYSSQYLVVVLRRPLEFTQFTSADFTGLLSKHAIAISMDGRGAWRDNVFVERLWRSVKYEEVYLRAYDSVAEARASIGRYLAFYNGKRPHSSLDAQTPDQAYFDRLSQRAAA
jgi:transposase InsO family protein